VRRPAVDLEHRHVGGGEAAPKRGPPRAHGLVVQVEAARKRAPRRQGARRARKGHPLGRAALAEEGALPPAAQLGPALGHPTHVELPRRNGLKRDARRHRVVGILPVPIAVGAAAGDAALEGVHACKRVARVDRHDRVLVVRVPDLGGRQVAPRVLALRAPTHGLDGAEEGGIVLGRVVHERERRGVDERLVKRDHARVRCANGQLEAGRVGLGRGRRVGDDRRAGAPAPHLERTPHNPTLDALPAFDGEPGGALRHLQGRRRHLVAPKVERIVERPHGRGEALPDAEEHKVGQQRLHGRRRGRRRRSGGGGGEQRRHRRAGKGAPCHARHGRAALRNVGREVGGRDGGDGGGEAGCQCPTERRGSGGAVQQRRQP